MPSPARRCPSSCTAPRPATCPLPPSAAGPSCCAACTARRTRPLPPWTVLLAGSPGQSPAAGQAAMCCPRLWLHAFLRYRPAAARSVGCAALESARPRRFGAATGYGQCWQLGMGPACNRRPQQAHGFPALGCTTVPAPPPASASRGPLEQRRRRRRQPFAAARHTAPGARVMVCTGVPRCPWPRCRSCCRCFWSRLTAACLWWAVRQGGGPRSCPHPRGAAPTPHLRGRRKAGRRQALRSGGRARCGACKPTCFPPTFCPDLGINSAPLPHLWNLLFLFRVLALLRPPRQQGLARAFLLPFLPASTSKQP